MSTVAKVIEVIGSSDKSWEAAADAAVETASETVSGIHSVQVQSMTGRVEDGKIVKFKTTLKLSFGVRD